MSNYQNYDAGGYHQSNYAAQGGFNGGGFIASQTTPSADRFKSNNALRPVQIKQINDASQSHADADFKIDGVEIGTLTFVGRVVNLSSAATNTTYKIDDETGTIEVKQWQNNDRPSVVVMDSYARVFGVLKSFNNKRHVQMLSIKPVTDDKEMEYHRLECKYVSLFFQKGPQQEQTVPAVNEYNNELQTKLNTLDPFSRKVMEAIHNQNSNEGVNVRILQNIIGGGGNLQSTIQALMEDGHLYSTIDEDHVKSTMI